MYSESLTSRSVRVKFGKIDFVAGNVVGSVNDDVSTISAGSPNIRFAKFRRVLSAPLSST